MKIHTCTYFFLSPSIQSCMEGDKKKYVHVCIFMHRQKDIVGVVLEKWVHIREMNLYFCNASHLYVVYHYHYHTCIQIYINIVNIDIRTFF